MPTTALRCLFVSAITLASAYQNYDDYPPSPSATSSQAMIPLPTTPNSMIPTMASATPSPFTTSAEQYPSTTVVPPSVPSPVVTYTAAPISSNSPIANCNNGMGVSVYVESIGMFCTNTTQICNGSTKGECPYRQQGLEDGSYCTVLSTSSYGCRAGGNLQCIHHVVQVGESSKSIVRRLCGATKSCEEGTSSLPSVFSRNKSCPADVIEGQEVRVCCGDSEPDSTLRPCLQHKVSSGEYSDMISRKYCGIDKGCTVRQQFFPRILNAQKEFCPEHLTIGETLTVCCSSNNVLNDSSTVNMAKCSPAQNSYPVSVEGIFGVFCANGPVLCAGVANGSCPEPQDGLPYGSTCGMVRSGVYGCQANVAKGVAAAQNEGAQDKQGHFVPNPLVIVLGTAGCIAAVALTAFYIRQKQLHDSPVIATPMTGSMV